MGRGRPRKYLTEEQRKAAGVQKVLRHRNKFRAEFNEYRRNYAKTHPEKIRQYNQRQYWKDHAKTLAYHVDYRVALKDEVIDAYGGKCSCCGESEKGFLTVEHVYGYKNRPDLYAHIPRGGTALYLWLRKNGYPKEDFAAHCFNCNLGKAHSPDGKCPHEKVQFDVIGIAC